jgi:hypothetical protein
LPNEEHQAGGVAVEKGLSSHRSKFPISEETGDVYFTKLVMHHRGVVVRVSE